MTLKEYFDSIDLNEIERYISEGQEEHLTLDFKTVNHPNRSEKAWEIDKKTISEVLSGFANSEGGIVIWGISTTDNPKLPDVAKGRKPIQELTKFINILNRLEGQAVTPSVFGVIHTKIEISMDTGYVKTYIPASEKAPHMANFAQKFYYKRIGDSFYQCEHYDIVDMFSRRKSPKLSFEYGVVKKIKKNAHNGIYHRYEIPIGIKNSGTVLAKYPYLGFKILSGDFSPDEFGVDGNRSTGLYKECNFDKFPYNYVGSNKIVIYPGNALVVDKLSAPIYDLENVGKLEIEYMLAAENMETIFDVITIDINE